VTDEVDVGRLAVVHSMEVIVTVDRVQGGVVGELLLRDGWVVLKTENGLDVVFALDSGQFTPMMIQSVIATVRKKLCSCLTILF
jgi:hypothetical protein